MSTPTGARRFPFEQNLLPSAKNDNISGHRSVSDTSSIRFKIYIIVSMTLIWTGYTLLVRHTRLKSSAESQYHLYASTTVVLLSESVKCFLSFGLLLHTFNFRLIEFKRCLENDFVGKPLDLIKMSVPSIMYAIQNNLDFVALSNLDAGTYQVTSQLKVVTTAIFMIVLLGRRFSLRRWIGIVLLTCGVATVQLNATEKVTVTASGDNYLIGLLAVLFTCITAGFAGVWFEMMLKDGTKTPFWIRNLQMYTCGIVSASVACYVADYDSILRRGFFYGYKPEVFCIIGLLSIGGIYISLVMKYLDNLYKSFAASVSIVLVVFLSYFLFENVHIGFFLLVGSACVVIAILLYNSVNE
ncbi:hypothetical protein AB6A40_005934 [Gnathostoma spinigerum]|uniref:UDP-galactose transporter n=1 Tax=Gnathostoma spinigerum TaxID=75299 RepID=A0ABD6EI21_9BILA